MIWRGQRISGSDLLIFPTGSELHALSEKNFSVYTLSVFDEALFNTASRLGVPGLETVFHKREVIHCRPLEMAETCKMLSDLVTFPFLHSFASNQILIALVHLLASAENGSASLLTKTRRQRVVLNSETLITKFPMDPMTVQRLCKHTGVSKRTLEYAFNEYRRQVEEAYINALTTKAADWSYEQEARFIYDLQHHSGDLICQDNRHWIPIPPEALREIIVGFRAEYSLVQGIVDLFRAGKIGTLDIVTSGLLVGLEFRL